MNENDKLSYELTKEAAKLSPGLIMVIIRVCKQGEKFIEDFTFALEQIHEAVKRFFRESADLVKFKEALEYRLRIINYAIDHGGALPSEEKTFDFSTRRALIELDLASKLCIERKIDMVAFDYAMVYCTGAIYSNMEEADRNQRAR
ncbi:MAG: hypothetical protein M1587_08595 [Thaumarchaeota archaeon]|nr:hypothetical protein [Nitrososphaerota archaeon]